VQPPSEANGPCLASDEDIQRVRLDKVTPHNAPITLADYHPRWPVLFAREAARIRTALSGRAVQVRARPQSWNRSSLARLRSPRLGTLD